MWFCGDVPDSPSDPFPDDSSDEPSPAAAPDSSESTAASRNQIFSPEFTKALGLYSKDDWLLGLAPGTVSMINEVTQLQRSWQDSATALSAEVMKLAPSSSLLDGLVPTAPAWLEPAFRTSIEIGSLIPEPIAPQSFVDSLLVSPMAMNLVGAAVDAISPLREWPTLTLPSWYGALSETIRLLNFPLPPLAESRRHLPRNWRSIDVEPDEVESEVREILEEGIPLAWVPAPRVIELLLDAPDAAARRRVITNNHRGILTSCEQLASRLSSPRALHYADIVRKSVRALRDGHTEAAQALASSLLDTLVGNHTRDALGLTVGSLKNASAYTATRKRGWGITLALHPLTVVMSGPHTTKNPTRRYNRNATVHAITRQQYTRVNAVLAIMNATSVLACFVRETPAFD